MFREELTESSRTNEVIARTSTQGPPTQSAIRSATAPPVQEESDDGDGGGQGQGQGKAKGESESERYL
ncbi:hypothetical protein FIBSPDRAFT_961474 [Athelia psychrophila]|uniref:Uncharacterized protein n=1 Tax=Athelia psychrophila TaxID=1759441 RepID=A0A166B986_9AGAM|nr:hypothetical protein FIBSPDRAFT_961474 [Fibularhizoctonia sp. CBS 109695]